MLAPGSFLRVAQAGAGVGCEKREFAQSERVESRLLLDPELASGERHLDRLHGFAADAFVGAQIDLGVGRMRLNAGQARGAG